ENDRKDAESKSYALEAMIKPLQNVDWHTLMAISAGTMDAKMSIAMAIRDLAENAQKIGQLNIPPDLLDSLLQAGEADGRAARAAETQQPSNRPRKSSPRYRSRSAPEKT